MTILNDIFDRIEDAVSAAGRRFLPLWDGVRGAVHAVPGVARFDAWAQEKETRWRRRRYAPLLVKLHEAGMHEQADRLSASLDRRAAS